MFMTLKDVMDNPSASTKEMTLGQKENYIDEKTMRIEACFGQRVQILRKKRHYTQMEFALLCNLHQHYISEVENGKRNVTLQVVGIIARALGVNPSELLP